MSSRLDYSLAASMFAPSYFNGHYFAPRYFTQQVPANSGNPMEGGFRYEKRKDDTQELIDKLIQEAFAQKEPEELEKVQIEPLSKFIAQQVLQEELQEQYDMELLLFIISREIGLFLAEMLALEARRKDDELALLLLIN